MYRKKEIAYFMMSGIDKENKLISDSLNSNDNN